tara:strand:+ start:218 stop:1045 length:828 start_codon:yes stop_codon:yes gene_type:complete
MSSNAKWVVALKAEAKPIIKALGLNRIDKNVVFPVYKDKNARNWLVISGVGQKNVVAAVKYISEFSDSNGCSVWINIGIAGSSSDRYGELFLIDKITRASSDECFYPGSILKSNLQKSELLTVDEPLLDYSKVDLVDMEAADFVRVTSKISGRDLVLVMKIVSDGPNNSVNDLTATRVSHLILQNINLVIDHVNKLISLASLEEERFENPKGYTAVIERWHFTVSQQHELKQLMKRWVVAYPFTNIIKKLKIMKNSREVLTFLKHDLDNYKIDWK